MKGLIEIRMYGVEYPLSESCVREIQSRGFMGKVQYVKVSLEDDIIQGWVGMMGVNLVREGYAKLRKDIKQRDIESERLSIETEDMIRMIRDAE